MNKNLKKKKKGFTLVEVIIVLAIIAIIAAIAIPNLTKVRQQSKIKADTQSVESLVKTVNMLITDETISHEDNEITFSYTDKKISGVTFSKGTAPADVIDYFKGIKQPQTEGKDGYKIIIKSGSVTGTLTTK